MAVVAALRHRGVQATPQAISALTETVLRSDPEYIGDTDTLLAGLLLSGSYTVDVLEQAGVSRTKLKRLTLESVSGVSRWTPDDGDPFEHGFAHGSVGEALIRAAESSKTPIDAADMLRAALTLEGESRVESIFLDQAPGAFPFEQRKDHPPDAPLLRSLEERLAEILLFVVGFFSAPLTPSKMLRLRATPITDDEDWTLDKELGSYFRGMTIDELEFIIRALNCWFVNRTILTSPSRLCLQAIERCTSLLFAPTHFVHSGGDLGSLEMGLNLARRLAPARDLPFMALFLHGDRVHAGHFTYRDSLLVPDYSRTRSIDIQGVQLFSPRPLPLVAASVLAEFERLLSRRDLNEKLILAFLTTHPQILLSLGYCSAAAHVCLRNPDGTSAIPDFILEIPGGRGVDILGLGSPSVGAAVRDPFLRASGELARAVAELRRNANYFDDVENRRRFESLYGLTGFRPQMIIVFGRGTSFLSLQERNELEAQLGNVRLLTYDDLIAYAKTRVIELPRAAMTAEEFESEPRSRSSIRTKTRGAALLHTAMDCSGGPTLTTGRTDSMSDSYDVALSFAGEDRVTARELATMLTSKGLRVFYDEYEQATLWGKDLYVHLSDIYSRRAKYCVMLLSKHYADKLWTNHERRAAQERAFREREEYILPLRLDDTEIPGILKTIGYLDLRSVNIERAASILLEKLRARVGPTG